MYRVRLKGIANRLRLLSFLSREGQRLVQHLLTHMVKLLITYIP